MQAQLAATAEGEERPGSQHFDDALLDDIHECLLTLEKRVKEGEGSLGMDEVNAFQAASQRVLSEMMEKAGEVPSRLNPGDRRAAAEIAAARAAAKAEQEGANPEKVQKVAREKFEEIQSAPPEVVVETLKGATTAPSAVPSPPPSQAHTQQAAPQAQAQSAIPEATIVKNESMDTSNDEGPEFDGKGGFGMSRETRNTYVLEGMDEMTADEYQEALTNKIISDAKSRRMSGKAGNRGTWDYLNYLNGGQSPNVLKRQEDVE